MKTKRQRTEIQIETHEITRIRFRKEEPNGQQAIAFDVENTANMSDRLLPDRRDRQGTEHSWLKTTEEEPNSTNK